MRYEFKVVPLWNLSSALAAVLLGCLSNFTVIHCGSRISFQSNFLHWLQCKLLKWDQALTEFSSRQHVHFSVLSSIILRSGDNKFYCLVSWISGKERPRRVIASCLLVGCLWDGLSSVTSILSVCPCACACVRVRVYFIGLVDCDVSPKFCWGNLW